MTAKQLAERLEEEVGWNKNTSYTVIKKLVEKGAIQRAEPHFMCHALLEKENAQQSALAELIEKFYDGSTRLLFASLLSNEKLTPQEIEELHKFIDHADDV